jgi:hypothetical protein
VAGRVKIGGVDVAATNTAFTHTFTSTSTSVVVSATGYPDKRVTLTLYVPQLKVAVTPSPLPAATPVQVTVTAVDTRTGAAVAGKVRLGGVEVAATNTAYTYTFGTPPPRGTVSATHYADTAVPWPAIVVRTMRVSHTPSRIPFNKTISVTFHAVDAQTGAAVAGRVFIWGADVAATNTPFNYLFRTRFVDGDIVYPPVVVRAPGYEHVEVNIGLL